MGFNKGVEEQMIMQIELIGYGIIGLILSLITMAILLDNFRLRKQFKEKMESVDELEKEMRFKFNLREINK